MRFFRVYEHANHIENNGGLMGNYVDLEAIDDERKGCYTEESLFLPPPLMAMAELFLTNSILEAMAMGIYKKGTFKQ